MLELNENGPDIILLRDTIFGKSPYNNVGMLHLVSVYNGVKWINITDKYLSELKHTPDRLCELNYQSGHYEENTVFRQLSN